MTRLPFSPPFSEEVWGTFALADFLDHAECVDYYNRCFQEVTDSGRSHRYVEVLAMVAHLGRLPEFSPKSLHRFREEALAQAFTETQLLTALDVILANSAPGDVLPTAAATFEFLAFVGDFVRLYAQHTGKSERLVGRAEEVRSFSILMFVAAVNREFELGRSSSN